MALTPDQERLLFKYIRDGQNTRMVNGDKLDPAFPRSAGQAGGTSPVQELDLEEASNGSHP